MTAPNTGAWQSYITVTQSLTRISGVHDVYLVFRAGTAAQIMNDNWFRFLPSG